MFQQDLQNADCIVIMGSNMAECHPVGFRWVMKARERGATIIHIDPRYTRTSANANLHVGIRSGSDIAFLGGLINYIIKNDRWFHEYVLNYTNAATIVSADYKDTEDLDGLFSGFDAAGRKYDNATWAYAGAKDASPPTDPTLTNPRCVFRILERHFARYTPEWSRACAGARQRSSRRSRKRSPTTRGATARRRSATRSAGPSTRSACR